MLRVESNTKLSGFTEFEEDILFDEDDPDFQQDVSSITNQFVFRVRRNMSAVGVIPAEIRSHHSSLSTLDRSLDDISDPTAWNLHDHVLTIEELRLQMSSCFTCGVSWSDTHVSLDCVECGGYALERPCPECEGKCGAIWKRDLSSSHASNKARWEGKCARKQHNSDLEECRAGLKQLSTDS